MMDARRVLEHHHMFALRAGRIAQLLDRGGGVVEQALAVGGIGPCAGDHARAVARTDTLLVSVDQRVERLRIDEALLDQQLLERLDPLGRLGERSIVVIMAVAMVVSVAHRLRPLRARVRERAAGLAAGLDRRAGAALAFAGALVRGTAPAAARSRCR